MGKMLEEALEAGAYGYSNGLEYALESAASEDETAELCRIVARAGALYATHERNKDIHAAEAIEEGIRVARASGARLQISHIIPRRGSPPGSIERVVGSGRGGAKLGPRRCVRCPHAPARHPERQRRAASVGPGGHALTTCAPACATPRCGGA